MVLGQDQPFDLVKAIREALDKRVPEDCIVLVAGDHPDAVLYAAPRTGWHFPEAPDGTYPGEPSSSLVAIIQLEALRARGADFLLLPQTSVWWLQHYPEFNQHLERLYRRVVDLQDVGIVFALRDSRPSGKAATAVLESTIADFQSQYKRSPAILDWHTNLNLAGSLKQHAVFSPVISDAVLPYLDDTIDMVVVSGDDPIYLAEARRVAGAVVVRAPGTDVRIGQDEQSGGTADHGIDVEWLVPLDTRATPSVSIIIPPPEGCADYKTALSALSQTLPMNFRGEVILVADRSKGAPSYDTDVLGNAIVVTRVESSDGFVAACNQAVQNATGDIILFLAPEALLLPAWLSYLLQTFRDHPDAGVVGGKIVSPDGYMQGAAGIILLDGSHTMLSHGECEAGDPAYGYLQVADFVSSTVLATSRDLFSALNGFDSRAYPDMDVDYCARVRKRGWNVYYQPKIVAVHPIVTSFRASRSLQRIEGL